MELSTIDLIIVGLILFLGVKGIVTGFTHELLNFIGLVGGIALASRINGEVGGFISENIYPMADEHTLKLVGFIATLIAVWIAFSIVSSMINRTFIGEISLFSRLLGYILTVARYVAIFALIYMGIERSEFLSDKLSKEYQNSKTLPILRQISQEILNESNSSVLHDINLNSIDLDRNQPI